MTADWESHLQRWVDVGIVDAATEQRIRHFESGRSAGVSRFAQLLIGLGGLTLAAGVLLFVAAHWEELAPAWRFSLVLSMVAGLHLSAVAAARSSATLATTLHAAGSIALGAGIYLTGQIFNLREHWPTGILLWGLGTASAWFLLRQWPQAVLTALLLPAWLASEWIEALRGLASGISNVAPMYLGPVRAGLLFLSLTYLSAVPPRADAMRAALMRVGAIAFLPLVLVEILGSLVLGYSSGRTSDLYQVAPMLWWLGYGCAYGLPLLLALALRGRRAWTNLLAGLWVMTWSAVGIERMLDGAARANHHGPALASYAVGALGAIGLIAWGMLEGRRERVNLGIAGFALLLVGFYFGQLFDQLGRAFGLIGIGILFVVGGLALERARRTLLARMEARQ